VAPRRARVPRAARRLLGEEPEHRAQGLVHLSVGVDEPALCTEHEELERIGASPVSPLTQAAVAALLDDVRKGADLAPWTRGATLDGAACARDEAMKKDGALEQTPYAAPLPSSVREARWGTHRTLADVQWELATSPSFRHLVRDARATHLALCAAPDGEQPPLRVLAWEQRWASPVEGP